jgi:hypothetical protein
MCNGLQILFRYLPGRDCLESLTKNRTMTRHITTQRSKQNEKRKIQVHQPATSNNTKYFFDILPFLPVGIPRGTCRVVVVFSTGGRYHFNDTGPSFLQRWNSVTVRLIEWITGQGNGILQRHGTKILEQCRIKLDRRQHVEGRTFVTWLWYTKTAIARGIVFQCRGNQNDPKGAPY